jgi:hypothetical protein
MTPASSSTSINPSYPLYSIIALSIRLTHSSSGSMPALSRKSWKRSDHSLAVLALEIGFVEDGLDAIECDADL